MQGLGFRVWGWVLVYLSFRAEGYGYALDSRHTESRRDKLGVQVYSRDRRAIPELSASAKEVIE